MMPIDIMPLGVIASGEPLRESGIAVARYRPPTTHNPPPTSPTTQVFSPLSTLLSSYPAG